jgi:hypothetical protein
MLPPHRTTRLARHLLLALLAAAVSCALGVATANAQNDGGDVAADYAEGKRLWSEGKRAEAEVAFERAWAKQKSYDVAGQLGGVELELDKFAEAAEHLSFAVANWAPSGNPEGKASAERRLQKALARVGAVRIDASVDGARIELNGSARDNGGGTLYLDPGKHTIVAKKDGYDPATATIEVTAASEQTVTLTLRPTTPPNGDEGEGPAALPVVAGVGFGLAGIGIGVAIGLTVADAGARSDFDARAEELDRLGVSCPDGSADPICTDFFDARDKASTLRTASIGTWIGAGAVAVATGIAVGVLAATGEAPEGSVTVVPFFGPQLGGLVFLQRF